jgi:hypothetical protein
MEKRKYNKKSSYWSKFEEKEDQNGFEYKDMISANSNNVQQETYEPALVGEDSFYIHESKAYSRSGSALESTLTRRNSAYNGEKIGAYDNIRAGLLPYHYSSSGADIRDAIELCQKAYANVPIFKNSIDMMSEFANSTLYLEGGSVKSKKFVEAWFKKIKMWNIKDQFFREYYRSSNVFFYEIDGKFNSSDFLKMSSVGLTPKENKIPVKYILLNPYDIVSDNNTSFSEASYKKILSSFEIEKLQSSDLEEDKEVIKALSKDALHQIKKGSYTANGIYVDLNPKRLHFVFNKKQDYEPFAMPFGFTVLDDINFKMEMKKIDQSICRTIENVVLLIKMGNEPAKGGINPKNIISMQNLFKNQSIGRVLVSDYTTEMEFIIPDLKKVLGPEKYEIVNKDIKEGLQNIIISEEKFANTEIKAKIFLQRLNEAREAFLNNFLQPEIKRVCENFGLRDFPEAKFETIDLKDTAQMNRVITRMMELGVISPDQGIKVIETGVWPTKEELKISQKQYVEDRKDGLYNPLVGGVPMAEDPNAPKGKPIPIKPKGNPSVKNPGRPLGAQTNASKTYSINYIKDVITSSNSFYSFLTQEVKNIFDKKRLSKLDKELIEKVCENVMISKEQSEWNSFGSKCLNNFDHLLEMKTIPSISEISAEHQIDEYTASLLYHSSKLRKD